MRILVTCSLVATLWAPWAWAGKAKQPDDGECVKLYKQDKLLEALECFRSLSARDPEAGVLYRKMGTVCARMGDREQGYKYYKRYIEKCPRCKYTQQAKEIVEQYEEFHADGFRGMSTGERATPSISTTRKARAKALADKAYALEEYDPDRARYLCKRVLRQVDKTDPSRKRCERLLARLNL